MKKVFRTLVAMLVIAASLTGCQKEKSSEKKILSFAFVSPAVQAVITENAKTIVATVPEGTAVTSMIPIITVSEMATVHPASGTPMDFTNPVTYTVTAEDGSQASYIVTVTFGSGGGGGGNGGTTDPTEFSGNIDANTTWPDLGLPVDYIVNGRVYINGNALLTIEPGVTIMFTGTNGAIEVGENAGLRMVGTADKPIKFVGPANNPNKGSRHQIVVNSKRADNVWEYVEFIRGGANDNAWSAVIDLQGAKVSMKNCTIDGSLGYGIDLEYETRFTAFEGNTIKNCAQYPIVSEDWIGLLDMGGNNTFESNGHNFIDARCRDINMEQHTTLKAMPIPYYMESGLDVSGGYKLTIEPGTQMYFKSEQNVDIQDAVTLVADGTAEKPIIFRGMEDQNSYWLGIKYHSTKEASVMNHCQILNCGEDYETFEGGCLCIYYGSHLTLTNCTIGKSLHYGITLDGVELFGRITHSNNTFVNCGHGNVWLYTGGEWNGGQYEDGQILEDLP